MMSLVWYFDILLSIPAQHKVIPSTQHILCVFNSINTIVTDIEGNIRIYRLPSGRGTNHEIDISLASGSGKIMFTGPYHDPWAVCISRYTLTETPILGINKTLHTDN
jgi:hypothetical protein